MDIQAIEYLKSSISISSYTGCSIGCKYCILSSLSNHNVIDKLYDEQELIINLLKHKYFVRNFTPITINNRTDPFLTPIIKKSTFKLLDYLEKENIKNPIILITKGYLNDDDINTLKKYKSNIFVFYTYSGISELLENRVKKLQIETIKKLSELNNIKLIHYWRPVIEGINTSDEVISEVSELAVKYFHASVVSGIRINSYLKKVFETEKLDILFQPNSEHKIIYDDTYEKIYNKLKELNDDYKCFKKTSCCICSFNKEQDYNVNFYDDKKCSIRCSNYNICHSKKIVSVSNVKKLLDNINLDCNFEIKDGIVIIDYELDQEQKIYLTHNLKMKIKPKRIKKSLSEENLSK